MDETQLLTLLQTIAPDATPDASLEQLRIPPAAFIGLVTRLRDAADSPTARLPPATELFAAMRLRPVHTLRDVAGRFSRAVAAAPPLCLIVELADPPETGDCRFWRDRSFRCRVLRAIRLWSRDNRALLSSKLGDLIPGDFTTAQLVALVDFTKTQEVFTPRTFPLRVPHGITGTSTGHEYAESIWEQQPETTDSCHFVPYEGPTA